MDPSRQPPDRRGLPGAGWWHEHVSVWVAAVLATGLAASLAAAGSAASLESAAAGAELDRRAAVAQWALTTEVQRYAQTVTSLAAAATAQQDLTARDFTDLTSPLTDSPLAGASGVAFVVPASLGELPAVSAAWQARGAGRFVPEGDRAEHLFAAYTTALDGAPGLPPGRDVSALAPAAAVLADARTTGRATMSDAYVLLKDRGLPAAGQQLAFSIAAPVYPPGTLGERPAQARTLRGWVVLTVRARDLAAATLRDAGQGLIDVTLTVPAAGGGQVAAAAVHSDAPDASLDARHLSVPALQQRWTLAVTGTELARHFRHGSLGPDRVIAGGGLALSLLLALLVWFLLSGRRRAEAQVLAATAELRAAEAASRASARLLEEQAQVQESLLGALSALGEGVLVVEQGRIVHANDAYARLTGYPLEELLVLDIPQLAPDEQARAEFAAYAQELAVSGRTAPPTTTRIRHRDGHAVPVELTGISIAPAEHVQRIGLVRDLSAQVRAQAELAERAAELETANRELILARDAATAASRAKSAFVARMSHEIRTPLNGVLGLTALLRDTDLDGAQRQLADQAARSGRALLAIVDDILDIAKVEAGKLTLEIVPADLAELVEDLGGLFAAPAAAKDLDLVVRCPPLSGPLPTDPTRLRQVLGNLLSNALKFTSSGSVTLEVRPAGSRLLVVVTDTGPGISADARLRLFDAFEQADSSTTRRYGGTGLGLTISRQLAELLGGTLEVSGPPGGGSAFTLDLPAAGVRAVAAEPALHGRRVLLLAATSPVRRSLHGQLTAWSATVLDGTVLDGTVLDRTGLDDVDVALLDARSPALAAVAARLAGVPVVVLHRVDDAPPQLPGEAARLSLPVRTHLLLHALRPEAAAGTVRAPAPAAPAADAVRPAGLHVLVADDNEVNQLVTRLMLDQLGHRVDVVDDGRQAVAAALRTSYDVVLMDCQMPVLDGLAATRLLRADPRTRALPVLALTAGVTAEERQACAEAGMDGWLSKPLLLEDLRAALETASVVTG